MAKLLRLFVGVPAYGGQISAYQARMWTEFGNTIGGSAERFELAGMVFADINGIDRARNFLLSAAFQANADWLLMIDADTWAEAESDDCSAGFQLLRMISDADRAGATIVGAPVARRDHTKAHEVMVYYLDTDFDGTDPKSLKPWTVDELGPGLKSVAALATAIMAINLRGGALGDTTFQMPPHLGGLSEDLDFCRKVRLHGGKILCDTRVNTRHLSRAVPVGPRPA